MNEAKERMLEEEAGDFRFCVCGKVTERREMRFSRDCHGIPFRLLCPDCYDKAMEKGYDGEYYTEADECIYEDY